MNIRSNLNRHSIARVRLGARRFARLDARLNLLVVLGLLIGALAFPAAVAAQDVTPNGAPVEAESLCLVPAPGDNNGTISGTITEEDGGAPIQGVIVRARDIYGRIQLQKTTSITGTYTIEDVYPGNWVVNFDTDGTSMTTPYIGEVYDDVASLGEASVLQVEAGENVTNINAALVVGAQLSGTVTSDENGEPVDFASVFVSRPSAPNDFIESALTNDDGEYKFRFGLPPGPYLLYFFAGGYHPEWSGNVAEPEDATPITIVGTQGQVVNAAMTPIPAPEEGRITGRITVAASGDPVPDAQVMPIGQGFYSLDRFENTDPQGYYTLTVPVGVYKLMATDLDPFSDLAPRYLGPNITYTSAVTFSVAANQTVTGKDIALEEGFYIEGTVLLPGGAPADLIRVSAYEGAGLLESGFRQQTQSDPDGKYELGPLPKIPFTLLLSPPSRLCDLQDTEITVLPEAVSAATIVETEMQQGMLISGRVTNAETGAGMRSAFVKAYDADGNEVAGAFSSDTGYYLLGALEGGSYHIGFEKEGFADQYFDNKATLATASVVAGTAGNGYLGIDAAMSVDPTGGVLENPVYVPIVTDN